MACLGPSLHLRESHGKEDGEEDDLEHFVVGRGLEEALRHDVLEESGKRRRLLRQLLSLAGRRRELHADPRPSQVDRRQSDDERQGGDDLEIDEGLERQAADPLHVVAVAGDADHQAAEDQRHHDRLDHPEEDGRERLQARSPRPGSSQPIRTPTTMEMRIHLVSDIRRSDLHNHFIGQPASPPWPRSRSAPMRGRRQTWRLPPSPARG